FNPKNSPVMEALIRMADLGNFISLGKPVEPEVFARTKSESEFHWSKKKEISRSHSFSKWRESNFWFEKSSTIMEYNLHQLLFAFLKNYWQAEWDNCNENYTHSTDYTLD